MVFSATVSSFCYATGVSISMFIILLYIYTGLLLSAYWPNHHSIKGRNVTYSYIKRACYIFTGEPVFLYTSGEPDINILQASVELIYRNTITITFR